MKIAVIGANGKVGKLIVSEALERGHEVVAIVCDKNKITETIHVFEKDVLSVNIDDLHEVDVVVNAMGAGGQDPVIYQDATMADQLYTLEQFSKAIYPTGMNRAKALDFLRDCKIMWAI